MLVDITKYRGNYKFDLLKIAFSSKSYLRPNSVYYKAIEGEKVAIQGKGRFRINLKFDLDRYRENFKTRGNPWATSPDEFAKAFEME